MHQWLAMRNFGSLLTWKPIAENDVKNNTIMSKICPDFMHKSFPRLGQSARNSCWYARKPNPVCRWPDNIPPDIFCFCTSNLFCWVQNELNSTKKKKYLLLMNNRYTYWLTILLAGQVSGSKPGLDVDEVWSIRRNVNIGVPKQKDSLTFNANKNYYSRYGNKGGLHLYKNSSTDIYCLCKAKIHVSIYKPCKRPCSLFSLCWVLYG